MILTPPPAPPLRWEGKGYGFFPRKANKFERATAGYRLRIIEIPAEDLDGDFYARKNRLPSLYF